MGRSRRGLRVFSVKLATSRPNGALSVRYDSVYADDERAAETAAILAACDEFDIHDGWQVERVEETEA